VVDDNQNAAETLAELLRLNGYLVETALDGLGAMDLIDRFNPQAVLLDCLMPQMGGFELATRLRHEYGDDMVLIAVSGQDERARGVGQTFEVVDHYLQKPVDLEKLSKVLPRV
jgi:DNA-binding response OmpR family regulator